MESAHINTCRCELIFILYATGIPEPSERRLTLFVRNWKLETIIEMTSHKSAFIILLTLLLFLPARIEAQDISVTNFSLAEHDLTATGREAVLDQNGDKCALIRVQTTQKGFQFDVGSAGITKVDDKHVGEIWLWVPYGIRHISIRHMQVGSLPNYNFPINIEKGRTYIMEITHNQVFVNNYDNSRQQMLSIKIVPAKSTLSLNGLNVPLNEMGETELKLAFGTYTYLIKSEGYYPKEGQIEINDSVNKQSLFVNDLNPILGKLIVTTSPSSAKIYVDDKLISGASSPFDIQIGKHKVRTSLVGYRAEEREVIISEGQTSSIDIPLSQVATYKFTSNPVGAHIYVNKDAIGTAPCFKELTTGKYHIKATKAGYKDYVSEMTLSSSEPNVDLELSQIYNYKTTIYAEANLRVGNFMAFGGTLGGYIHNVNIELAYLMGTGKSETIYWSGNNTQPIVSTYSPNMTISGKVGYGVSIGTRYRLTPQLGCNLLKLKETIDSSSSPNADGAYVLSGLLSIRFSAALANHFAISISPEYSFAISKSNGYTVLSEISPKIKKWGEGFNVKIGITAFL